MDNITVFDKFTTTPKALIDLARAKGIKTFLMMYIHPPTALDRETAIAHAMRHYGYLLATKTFTVYKNDLPIEVPKIEASTVMITCVDYSFA